MIVNPHPRAAAGLLLALGLWASSAVPVRAEGEAEFLAGTSKSCPRCALEQASLKRRDLSGADLSAAKLARAVLHRAQLARAKLTGADLSEANLNKTDLKYASLVETTLAGAMLYEADLGLADLTGATLDRHQGRESPNGARDPRPRADERGHPDRRTP